MRVRIKFVPRDCWIGAYWDTKYETGFYPDKTGRYGRWLEFKLYVCLVPCFPVIFSRLSCWKETSQ